MRRADLLHSYPALGEGETHIPRFARLYCWCGQAPSDPYDEWDNDPACPRCHGTGAFTRWLSRREHHVLLVAQRQIERAERRVWQSFFATYGKQSNNLDGGTT